MEGLRVSDLAERAGIAPSTVRFYERAGLLSPARRAAERASGTIRLALPAGPDTAATVAALCAAETVCSARNRFILEVTAGQITLIADAPGIPDLLDTLFPVGTPGLR